MYSSAKNARSVWRTTSVDVTRLMPSRYATSVATVDLPVPVAPPISRMIGLAHAGTCCGRRDSTASSRPSPVDVVRREDELDAARCGGLSATTSIAAALSSTR